MLSTIKRLLSRARSSDTQVFLPYVAVVEEGKAQKSLLKIVRTMDETFDDFILRITIGDSPWLEYDIDESCDVESLGNFLMRALSPRMMDKTFVLISNVFMPDVFNEYRVSNLVPLRTALLENISLLKSIRCVRDAYNKKS